MGAGVQKIRSLPGPFSVDLLRLSSPPPLPLPPVTGGGSVLDPGRLGHSSLSGARVTLHGRAWLVLGQSFSKGWRATCNGRSLGEPRPIEGYANGWRAPAGCRRVAFDFRPQDIARAGYAISALVCLALLVLLVVGLVVRRRDRPDVTPPPPLPEERTERMPLVSAAALAFVGTIPLSGLFAGRSVVLIFPALTLILWLGVGPRTLTAVAAALAGVALPIMYAIVSPKNRGGYNFEYSLQLFWAHWVGVAAIILLMVACSRTIAAAYTGQRRKGPRPPAGVAAPRGEGDEHDLDLAGTGQRAGSA
jgi:hypothetical protein